jgi:hypothetical protein
MRYLLLFVTVAFFFDMVEIVILCLYLIITIPIGKSQTFMLLILQPAITENPVMKVTDIILLKSRDFVSCRVTVVGFFLGYIFLHP